MVDFACPISGEIGEAFTKSAVFDTSVYFPNLIVLLRHLLPVIALEFVYILVDCHLGQYLDQCDMCISERAPAGQGFSGWHAAVSLATVHVPSVLSHAGA